MTGRPIGITMMMLLYPAMLFADSITLRDGTIYEGVIANKEDLYYLVPPVPYEYRDYEISILSRDGTMYRFEVQDISHVVMRDAYGRHVIDLLANSDDLSPRKQGIAFATIGLITMGLGVSQKFGTSAPPANTTFESGAPFAGEGAVSLAPREARYNALNVALVIGGGVSLALGLKRLAEPASSGPAAGPGGDAPAGEGLHEYTLGMTPDAHGFGASYSYHF
ncbi:MAG: hypothetical protein HKN20_16950 [Gemmatimonadetes bacterium]|nr:hypothetical protein [Gemmatimonadota bacterium]